MLNKSKMTRFLTLGLFAAGFMLIGGDLSEVSAQCKNDPFCQPSWKRPAKPATAPSSSGAVKPVKKGPPPVVPVNAPPIEARINYYKQIREQAAANGQPIPKVTSVLTLDEMAVTGIFKTARGYAAMVEATPIKLSYSIYPGEKFFDGQLVAIEENRLVFRKVVKMSDNKFVTSVENKTLRQYTVRQEIEGTAPTENKAPATNTETANTNAPAQPAPTQSAPTQASVEKPAAPTQIVSPVDEMNRPPVAKPEDTGKDKGKKTKKATKVAKKS
jgi:hypothetical protein